MLYCLGSLKKNDVFRQLTKIRKPGNKYMDSLQGSFLIATARMPDPRFRQQVVYLCSHSLDEGAMGIVINHPIEHGLVEILKGAELPVPAIPLPSIYLGGPVEPEAGFFLFTADYEAENCVVISETVRLSNDIEILRDISSGNPPKKFLFALGYSGWAPGQLEGELGNDGWLALPADEEIIFNTPDQLKWERAAARLGIDITTFEDISGSA